MQVCVSECVCMNVCVWVCVCVCVSEEGKKKKLKVNEKIDKVSKLAAFHFEERKYMQKHNAVYMSKEEMVKKE